MRTLVLLLALSILAHFQQILMRPTGFPREPGYAKLAGKSSAGGPR